MLIDLLDNLEWYRPLHQKMQLIIDILDRSLPYDDAPGEHQVDGISYRVVAYVTDERGTAECAKSQELHVVLEGEELFSLQTEGEPVVVAHLTTGSFVLMNKTEQYRHRQIMTTAAAVKKVIFRLEP